MKFLNSFIFVAVVLLVACSEHDLDIPNSDSCQAAEGNRKAGKAALLASRIEDLQEFKSIVKLNYYKGSFIKNNAKQEADKVIIEQCVSGKKVTSILEIGISQEEIAKAEKGDVWDKIDLLIRSPYTIQQRKKLKSIYVLARRRYDLFGVTDVAFYDLAETAVGKIKDRELAYLNPRDSSEKGFINSFNHVTAQALITTIYSDELADFIADVHERYNMPELIQGRFSEQQMNDPDNNPVDNYVDLLNNEWGQKLGTQMKDKYKIHKRTKWTPELLATYLNEIQQFYSWSFNIEMEPFRPEEEVIQLFSNKLNVIVHEQL